MNAKKPLAGMTDLAAELQNLNDNINEDKFTKVPPDYLIPDPEGQDRNGADWETPDAVEYLQGLAASASIIVDGKPFGIRSPIEVKPTDNPRVFHIIAGESRWRAAKMAKLPLVPVLIKRAAGDQELSMDRLVENVVRRNLSLMQLAEALKKRLDQGISRDDLRKLVGNKSSAWLTKYMSPLKMGEDLQRLARDGLINNVELMKALDELKGKAREKALAKILKGEDVRSVVDKFCGKKAGKDTGSDDGEPATPKAGAAGKIAISLTTDEALGLLRKLGMDGEFDSPEQIRDTIIEVARGGK